MDEKRSDNDRRSDKDVRKGSTSPYNGPERRTLRYKRSGTDRRYQEISMKLDAVIVWFSAFGIATLFFLSLGYLLYSLILH
jgi:hypothetical protein